MITSKKMINIANSLLRIIVQMISGFLISLVKCMIYGFWAITCYTDNQITIRCK